MPSDPLAITALSLFFVGILGMLIRRSFVVALLSLQVSTVGGALLFCSFALQRQDGAGLSSAIIVVALACLLSTCGAAVTIAVFRRRGTVNLDELRELRG